jgi:excisionase family DNA binding protein
MPITIADIKLYNVEELAELLHLTERTIRDLLRTGELRGKKFAGRWYVSEEWLRDTFGTPDVLEDTPEARAAEGA